MCFSYLFFFYLNPDLNLFLHVVVIGAIYHWHSAKWGVLAENTPLTGYEPNIPDEFHYSETAGAIQRRGALYLFDAQLDDETIGRALSSPLFIQEREEPAGRRQADHSFEESLLPAQSFSVCYARTGRPVHELSSPGSSSSREMENETREELQKKKSHVLKVEELSRRKLTEDFLEVTSYFQGSTVKTVYNLGDNDAKYPDAEIDDEHIRNSLASPLYLLREREASASLLQVYHSQKRKLEHTRNSLGSPLYLQKREASASLLQVYHSQRESLFQRAQSIFSKYGETRNLDVTKAQI